MNSFLDHAAKLHELPDEHLSELLPIVKKIAIAVGCENYNILQNNGRIAHQQVDHLHFHSQSILQLLRSKFESLF